jgi:uncharacterized protein (DUF2249 family)
VDALDLDDGALREEVEPRHLDDQLRHLAVNAFDWKTLSRTDQLRRMLRSKSEIDFPPIGQLFSLDSSSKIAEVTQIFSCFFQR